MTITKQKPIKAPTARSEFAGEVWQKNGVAVAATDGRWMTARAKSLEEAAVLLETADENVHLPDNKGAARLVRDANNNGVRGSMNIDAATKPDAAHWARASARREAAVQAAEAALVQAQARLAETLARPKSERLLVTEKRKAVVAARNTLRLSITKPDVDFSRIDFDCAGASFDLGVIREALRSLGEFSATLDVSGTYDPGVLRTATGIALVMPFRAS